MTLSPGSVSARVTVIADSDSYLKWGAALASTLPPSWHRHLVILRSPVVPSPAQEASALAGTDFEHGSIPTVSLPDVPGILAAQAPDVVLIALRGPLVRVVVRSIESAVARGTIRRPVLVSGMPGITIPAARKALVYRSQIDLIVLHSRREIAEFSRLADEFPGECRLGLATLPFLRTAGLRGDSGGTDVIFAAQAKVPAPKEQRLELLGWLAEHALRNPHVRVVVKIRAEPGEHQTHAEAYFYSDLVHEVVPQPPANLVVEAGPMTEHLARAGALVTVSSTAAIESVAQNIPTLVLDDFGVRSGLINTVFEGSGLFGSGEDLIHGRFRTADPAWLDDNYLHSDAGEHDWQRMLAELVVEYRRSAPRIKPQVSGRWGGGFRRAWDRKSALLEHDHTLSGRVAFFVGVPARWGLRRVRRVVRAITRVFGVGGASPDGEPGSPPTDYRQTNREHQPT